MSEPIRVDETPEGCVPVCELCGYSGKPQPRFQANAGLKNHCCSAGHRRVIRQVATGGASR